VSQNDLRSSTSGKKKKKEFLKPQQNKILLVRAHKHEKGRKENS
jgi:hypothetical protein